MKCYELEVKIQRQKQREAVHLGRRKPTLRLDVYALSEATSVMPVSEILLSL